MGKYNRNKEYRDCNDNEYSIQNQKTDAFENQEQKASLFFFFTLASWVCCIKI